jgi:hypothetical protein
MLTTKLYQIDTVVGGDSSRNFFVDGPTFTNQSQALTTLLTEHVCVVDATPNMDFFIAFIHNITYQGQVRVKDRLTSIVIFYSNDHYEVEFNRSNISGLVSNSRTTLIGTIEVLAQLCYLWLTKVEEFHICAYPLLAKGTIKMRPSSVYSNKNELQSLQITVRDADKGPVTNIALFFFFDLKTIGAV